MNGNWAVKLNTLKPVQSHKGISFDENALNAHRNAAAERNSQQISSLIQGLELDPNIDTGRVEEGVPEFGSPEAVNATTESMVNEPMETNFELSLGSLSPVEHEGIEFDQNALANHRQNGLKGTIKSMLGSIIGMAMA